MTVPCEGEGRVDFADTSGLEFGTEYPVVSMRSATRDTDPSGARVLTIALPSSDSLTVLWPAADLVWHFATPTNGDCGTRVLCITEAPNRAGGRQANIWTTVREDFPM